MTLNPFRQLECDEIRKVVQFLVDPLPRSSTLVMHILLQNNCIDKGVTNSLKLKKEKKHAKELYLVTLKRGDFN